MGGVGLRKLGIRRLIVVEKMLDGHNLGVYIVGTFGGGDLAGVRTRRESGACIASGLTFLSGHVAFYRGFIRVM